jgi:hypothetical protein
MPAAAVDDGVDEKCYNLCVSRCPSGPPHAGCFAKCEYQCSHCGPCRWAIGGTSAACKYSCTGVGTFYCDRSACADQPCPPGICDCPNLRCGGIIQGGNCVCLP